MKTFLFVLAFVALAAAKEYLPTTEELEYVDTNYFSPDQAVIISSPNKQNLDVQSIEQLADDGYRYKTLKRLRFRKRRDVNEFGSTQYLPPGLENSYAPPPSGPATPVPIQTFQPTPMKESAILANDGYHYKTVKRIRYRHRRDVN